MKFKTACLAASLAAAGLATTGLAQAQSKVELYGIVDVNVEVYNNAPDGKGGKHTVSGMRSGGQNGSRWGLRGSEDLGNGLKAIFALEGGFNTGTGRPADTNRIFNRQAFAGLQGDWGALTFGRQYTPSHSAIVANTPAGFPSQYEPVPYISPVRGDNMIKYQGTFSGFSVGAYYGFSEQTAQMTVDQGVTGRFGGALGYNYQNRFRVMAAYDRIEDGNFASTGGLPVANAKGKADNWLFAARGDFGQFYVLGGYRHRKWEMNGISDVKSDLFMIGAGYRYREGSTISVGYFYDKLKNATPAMTNNAVRKSNKWQQVNVFGTYALSKRTNLYATVAYSHNGALNMGFGGDGGNYALGGNAKKQAGGAIGIRHLF
ncbi:MAG: porin [Pigmentiphaga sp.]|nr:porin [Pigmentiphaga sp.]